MQDTIYLHYQPERDYLLSLMATEHLLPRETPSIFVSNSYVLYPPAGGAWYLTMVPRLLDPILQGVRKPSKAADEMCCNENSSVCLHVCVCVSVCCLIV